MSRSGSRFTSSAADYRQLDEITHALEKPDMYLDSLSVEERTVVLSLPEGLNVTKVMFPTPLEQLFMEALGNGADNVWRSREKGLDPKQIEVTHDIQNGFISIQNYGSYVPIEVEPQTGLYVPQMIFFTFRSGSNFDPDRVSFFIGKNGFGIKLAFVYSSFAEIQCADPERGKLYVQRCSSNMRQIEPPTITDYVGEGFVRVTFYPEFWRFESHGFDTLSESLFRGHCYAVAYTCQIPVIFNGQMIPALNLQDYGNQFIAAKGMGKNSIVYSADVTEKKKVGRSFTDVTSSYQLMLMDTPNQGFSVSYVNGMYIRDGGVHVNEATREMVDKVLAAVRKGTEDEETHMDRKDVVKHISLILSCRLHAPRFNGQAKAQLNGPKITIKIPDELLSKVGSWKAVKEIKDILEGKLKAKLKTTDGKRKTKYRAKGVEPANWAGGPQREQTCLYIVEGESASTYTKQMISLVPNRQGRDLNGILYLHGKLLNACKAAAGQQLKNRDFINIKGCFGFKEDEPCYEWSEIETLNYRRARIMADADDDGIHIIGLIIAFFCSKVPGFVYHQLLEIYLTPILRLFKGKDQLVFYTSKSFRTFEQSHPDWKKDGWKPKYQKGLATSTKSEVAYDSQNPRVIKLNMDQATIEAVSLAFGDKRTDHRKIWLQQWLESEVLDISPEAYTPIRDLSVSQYIYNVIPEYIVAAIYRAIPGIEDGLKESHRKLMDFGVKYVRSSTKDKKVMQLSCHTAEKTVYNHGESNLADTCIRMTMDFMGSNNLPYFEARSSFGTRYDGGKDVAAARYLNVGKAWWLDLIYRKEDKCLLKRLVDEGEEKEYASFYPILPTHLMNGQEGIAMAYSCQIPKHNPLDVAFWFQIRASNELDQGQRNLPLPRPWYRGFKGSVEIRGPSYLTRGLIKRLDQQKFLIEELPIGTYPKKYLEFLDELVKEKVLADYQNNCSDEDVYITLIGYQGRGDHKDLRLISRGSYTNMTLLCSEDQVEQGAEDQLGGQPPFKIKRFNNLLDLLEDFFQRRLKRYRQRIDLQIEGKKKEIDQLNEKLIYIHYIRDHPGFLTQKRSTVLEEIKKLGIQVEIRKKVSTDHLDLEAIKELEEKILQCQEEIKALEKTHPASVWLEEINEFVSAYCKHYKVQPSDYASCPPLQLTETEEYHRTKSNQPDKPFGGWQGEAYRSLQAEMNNFSNGSAFESGDDWQTAPSIEVPEYEIVNNEVDQ